jgi:hypothetical protein
MTIYDRIKNNINWPLRVNSVLFNKNNFLMLHVSKEYPILLSGENMTTFTLTENGKLNSDGKCLISPINTLFWENIYYPKIGEYVTRKDTDGSKIITYITSLRVTYAYGISFIECSNIITNTTAFIYEGCTKRQPSTQEEIDLFNSKLKEQNLEIKNGQLVSIHSEFPKSWEEYCKNPMKKGYILFKDSQISEEVNTKIYPDYQSNTFQTKELAEAINAFHKLIILRKEWIKDWKPTKEGYWAISFDESIENNFDIYKYKYTRRTFSFPTKEMAVEFLETFINLFKIAIPVL